MSTAHDRAQAHAKHAHFCSWGWVLHGNGARAAHGRMHARRGDVQHYVTRTTWESSGRPYLNHPDPARRGNDPGDRS